MEQELRSKGYATKIVPSNLSDPEKRAVLDSLGEPTLIYIQKAGNSFHIPDNFLPYKKKHPLVFDFDDYIAVDKLNDMISVADSLICGSHFLKKYAENFVLKTSYLLECCVDEHMFFPSSKKQKSALRVIWSQSYAEVYSDDLLSIADVLNKLKEKYNFELILCGFRNFEEGKIKQKVARRLPFAQLIDYQPLDEFRKETLPLLSQADIAVVPFLNDDSRNGKAGLTLRNNMLMGIPCIASAVGEHNYIINNGENGFLAQNCSDWEKYLEILIKDETKRREIGENSRESILDRYSIKSRSDKLETYINEIWEAFNKPSKRDHKKIKSVCAVIVCRIDADKKSMVAEFINEKPVLKYIEEFLLNTGLIGKVVFALPDDDSHKRFAESLHQYDLNIAHGDPNNTKQRFINLYPAEFDVILRMIIEKPFIDRDTLISTISQLGSLYGALLVADPDWGIHVEAYTNETLALIKNSLQSSHSIWQAVESNVKTKTAKVSFLSKPCVEPILTSFASDKQLSLFKQYVKTNGRLVFENYQDFLISSRETERTVIYDYIKSRKNLSSCEANVCYVLDKLYDEIDFDAVLKKISKNGDRIFLCIDESINPTCFTQVSYHKENITGTISMDRLDLALERASVWASENNIGAVYSLTTGSTVFAVRLGNVLNVPVVCTITSFVDPKDTLLVHHLKMANKIIKSV